MGTCSIIGWCENSECINGCLAEKVSEMRETPTKNGMGMTTIKDRLRARRITGMFGNNDPNHWGIELNEGVDPLCIEAADKIELLERENAILKIKAGASLANNLCPDHRDKQNGQPCLACTIERIKADLAKARRDVLEEAALLVERNPYLRAQIRALKDKP